LGKRKKTLGFKEGAMQMVGNAQVESHTHNGSVGRYRKRGVWEERRFQWKRPAGPQREREGRRR